MEKKRILLADPSSHIIKSILENEKSSNYMFKTTSSGPECIRLIKEFKPHLILLEMMLPHMHGIEILKILKADEETRSIGVIITTSQILIQNYYAAVEAQADFFLEKPFSPAFFFDLVKDFFEGTLKLKPFSGKLPKDIESDVCFIPTPFLPDQYIRFWGTRGSNPVSGAPYMRFGGNTCCLELRVGDDLIIIDAGTGIRPLGAMIAEEKPRTIHLFIGHTHWDHIAGFPFFNPLYEKNFKVIIHAPIGFEKSTKELFTDVLAYSLFPVRLDDMRSQLIFKELRDETPFNLGEITIEAHYAYHPGPTFGFKITTPKKTIGYVTDNEVLMGFQGHPNEITFDHPLLDPHLSLIHFLKGCDLIIHEAQYFPKEYHQHIGWGHSSITNASILIKYTDINEWVVTHHDPAHTDEDLQKKLQLHQEVLLDCDIHCHLSLAFDGLIIPL